MKYQNGKIKVEHNILNEFKKFLNRIQNNSMIKRIIPGRISRQQKGSSFENISFSYYTKSGLKFIMKKGSTAQEIFFLCEDKNKEILKDEIIKQYNIK